MPQLRRALYAATALALGLAGAVVLAAPASALGCEVTSATDSTSDGSLRYAVEQDGCSVVTFGPAFAAATTITLDGALGPIDISETKMIVGPGSELLTVTRGSDPTDYNMFQVGTSSVTDVTVSGLTITGDDAALGGSGSAFQVFDDEVRHVSFSDVVFSRQNAGFGAGLQVQGNTGNVTVTNCEFLFNDVDGRGGGLYAFAVGGILSITGTTFADNTAPHGGALSFASVNTVNIDSSIFERNIGTDSGGAIGLGMSGGYGAVTITNTRFIENDAQTGYGGAIYTDGSSSAPFTIARSTFDGNSATSDDEDGALGGAIYVDGVDEPFTIDSSTFTRNSTNGFGTSVAVADIDDDEASLFFIVNSTFDEDLTAASGDRMIFVETNNGTFAIAYSTLVGYQPVWVGNPEPGVSTVTSTIVQSGAGQSDLFNADDPFQVQYSILSKPHEPLNVTNLGNTQFSTNALLGSLADNGGPTQTRMPAPTSPAVGMGGPTLGAPLYDQRFDPFPRIAGVLDVGAVEVAAALPATGSTVPLWIPVVGGVVLLLGVGAIVFTVVSRRRLHAAEAAVAPTPPSDPTVT